MMSSNRDDWETPQDLFDNLDKEFGFVIDAAASPENAKTDVYFTKEDDGLVQNWTETTWLNPPYGRVISKWLKKAYEESIKNRITVVVLMAARTDTKYFHDYVMKASEIWFVKGRLRFVGAPTAAPFPSMIVVFDSFSPFTDYPTVLSCDPSGNILDERYKQV